MSWQLLLTTCTPRMTCLWSCSSPESETSVSSSARKVGSNVKVSCCSELARALNKSSRLSSLARG